MVERIDQFTPGNEVALAKLEVELSHLRAVAEAAKALVKMVGDRRWVTYITKSTELTALESALAAAGYWEKAHV